MKIDVHSHILPRYMPKWSTKFGYGNFIHLEEGSRPGYARMMQGDTFFREIASNCWDEKDRIGEYAQFGVQTQVVCTIPVMFSYNAKPQDALELGTFLNDHIADLVAKFSKKYIGLCTVPMQDTELAIQELERAKSIGHVGVQIGSNINGINLSDPQLFPFFQACERLGMAILIHPWDMMGKSQMEKYWLPWLVGMPAEVSRAACSLIFGGVLERLPKLRVLFSHASGAFLATLGRIEHGFNCRPDLVAIDNNVNPRKYCGKFWVDSITHDEKLLKYVIDMQGVDRICMGTDYPFPLGDLKFGEYMEKMNLDQQSLESLFHRSAMSWLDLDVENYK
ncbi:MAG: 2-amino-3-carboxymuconate-6-semialdehyde decarboxylase [Crocinitomicaceae bacterium]|nr:2-amino-3-carboxymuconate-6-semialdehyde decarboxylase [Crocinitomicaceae bacterium]